MSVVYNPLTGQLIVLPASSGGGTPTPAAKYFQSFVVANWVLSGSDYIITVPAATHATTNPIVTIYEKIGSDFEQAYTNVTNLANNDIIIKINSSPDVRFDGLIIIS